MGLNCPYERDSISQREKGSILLLYVRIIFIQWGENARVTNVIPFIGTFRSLALSLAQIRHCAMRPKRLWCGSWQCYSRKFMNMRTKTIYLGQERNNKKKHTYVCKYVYTYKEQYNIIILVYFMREMFWKYNIIERFEFCKAVILSLLRYPFVKLTEMIYLIICMYVTFSNEVANDICQVSYIFFRNFIFHDFLCRKCRKLSFFEMNHLQFKKIKYM